MDIKINRVNRIGGFVEVPSDKSITHRAVILSSIAEGNSIVKNYLPSEDCHRTIEAFKQMGADIKSDKDCLYIKGCGLKLKEPKENIYAGNSGTTARLLSGIIAGQNFTTTVSGDESLSKRDMNRVIEPLTLMGASFNSANGYLPMTITGNSPLKAINYKSSKSSAQVKSAILFAGLYADNITTYSENIKSRDHSERMLSAFGADIKIDEMNVSIAPAEKLNAQNISIVSDLSSAAFFIAAAILLPNSDLTIKNVGINPTRDGFIKALKKMGANIVFENIKEISGELSADIRVKYSKLNAINIGADIVPSMIDEIPIFALLCARAEGISKITGAKELRVKESDRIKAIVSQFNVLGIEIEELEDGFIVYGNCNSKIKGGEVESFLDHRIAMTLAVAALVCENEILIKDSHCVNISFPNFYEVLRKICL